MLPERRHELILVDRDDSFTDVAEVRVEEKDAIAHKCADLVKDGETVLVLVADVGKFPGTGMARVCGPKELDVVVTNSSADEKTCIALREAGVEVVEA